jgi:hypothetical protein
MSFALLERFHSIKKREKLDIHAESHMQELPRFNKGKVPKTENNNHD